MQHSGFAYVVSMCFYTRELLPQCVFMHVHLGFSYVVSMCSHEGK